MLFTNIVRANNIEISCAEKALNPESFYSVDSVVAIALIVLGSLGIAGILPFSPAVSGALIGGGIIYILSMISDTMSRVRSQDTKDQI